MIAVWILVFIASIVALVKGSDWLLSSAEKVGLALGLSSFIIGVTIIALGTSFPELVYSLAAVSRGVDEVVAANAVGSNVANLLLVVGVTAVIARRVMVKKDLINIDLPLLAASTALFLMVALDREVTLFEALLLLLAYAVYVLYTIFEKENRELEEVSEAITGKDEGPGLEETGQGEEGQGEEGAEGRGKRLPLKTFFLLALGVAALYFGSTYLIEAVVELSELLDIGVSVITITAVAIGTSLPELVVTVRAVRKDKPSLALGNVMGSCIFNLLVVVGLPALFTRLSLDENTFSIALPVMVAATVLFVIAGISRRIHIWEGSIFLIIYVLFIARLFNLF
jgi:cation:H+ antiporter